MMGDVKLRTRAEMLAAILPIEMHRVSVTPQGVCTPVVYRYETEQDRDNHLKEERRILETNSKRGVE